MFRPPLSMTYPPVSPSIFPLIPCLNALEYPHLSFVIPL